MVIASPALAFAPDHWGALLFRFGLALVAGALLGVNRNRNRRPAGSRLYMTVSVSSALLVIIALQVTDQDGAAAAVSLALIGIVTAVGLIGAGLIIQRNDSSQVKGLTSAAALLLTAALGIAAGCGLWQTTLVGTLVGLFILKGLTGLKDRRTGERFNFD